VLGGCVLQQARTAASQMATESRRLLADLEARPGASHTWSGACDVEVGPLIASPPLPNAPVQPVASSRLRSPSCPTSTSRWTRWRRAWPSWRASARRRRWGTASASCRSQTLGLWS
jgi:hypothetical protein